MMSLAGGAAERDECASLRAAGRGAAQGCRGGEAAQEAAQHHLGRPTTAECSNAHAPSNSQELKGNIRVFCRVRPPQPEVEEAVMPTGEPVCQVDDGACVRVWSQQPL